MTRTQRQTRQTFGPSAIATPANALTVLRLLAAPAFAFFIVVLGPRSWWLWTIWIVLASSDGLDGHLARRLGTTSSGAFLDPLADKFLVLGALGVLVGEHVFSPIPVALIAFREIAMSVFRTRVSRLEISIPARNLAKWKTIAQDFSIGCAFFPPFHASAVIIPQTLLWIATALTLYTGLEYLIDGRRLMARSNLLK
ncbi:MAG TPA: CDP-alcohol phosphatidyltransferase family protein [Acidimicrobiales bacterium]|nr:CDP-alcohol phosphatidyltransferase family protein [Acidimicrobiales bacterium]